MIDTTIFEQRAFDDVMRVHPDIAHRMSCLVTLNDEQIALINDDVVRLRDALNAYLETID